MSTQGRSHTQQIALTFLIAAAGTLGFWAVGGPLPFLFGPLSSCLVFALLGLQLRGFPLLSKLGRVTLGTAVGASITPALVSELPTMLASLALIPLYILAIALVGFPFLYRVGKLDKATAFYAAMPGGLQDMVQFGIESGGNARALSLIHAIRLLGVVVAAPFVLTLGFGVSMDRPVGIPAADLPGLELILLLLAGLSGWKIAEHFKMFGATVLGPMIAATAFSLLDWIHIRPPQESLLAAQFVIGIGVGVFYTGLNFKELKGIVLAALGYLILSGLVAIGVIWLAGFLGLTEGVEAFLAFAPGGQAEMTIMAIVVGADLGFVVAHHLSRLVIVILCAPIIMSVINRLFFSRRS